MKKAIGYGGAAMAVRAKFWSGPPRDGKPQPVTPARGSFSIAGFFMGPDRRSGPCGGRL